MLVGVQVPPLARVGWFSAKGKVSSLPRFAASAVGGACRQSYAFHRKGQAVVTLTNFRNDGGTSHRDTHTLDMSSGTVA